MFRSLAAAAPLLMELPLDDYRADAKKSMEKFIAWRMCASVSHRDNKIVAIHSTEEDKLREQTALSSNIQLSLIETVLRYVLGKVFERMQPADLFELVRECPGLDRARLPFLARASERFRSEDWISCGVITSVIYEAVLRDFVRWTGSPARTVTPDGIHADQTLGDMLRSEDVRRVIGREHADLVTHVLADPVHGVNLRNDVGHGTANQHALPPERILLVWLFMARLALIRPITDEDSDGSHQVSTKPERPEVPPSDPDSEQPK